MHRQPPSVELRALVDDIDIYLFDQILRGRFDHRHRVLDAGCGGGRNLRYLLSRGFDCYAVDRDAQAIEQVTTLARTVGADLPASHVHVGELDTLPWSDGAMDAVIASAVLHFARDTAHAERMVMELGRVLAPGGLLVARLASTIGLESVVGPGGRRVRLPDGSDRFVVDESVLLTWTDQLGGHLADPLKTTVVQGLRAMTTWCVIKA